MTASGLEREPRYRAFISYSHKDAGFGRRLHHWLEGYTIPRRLVGRPGGLGPVPVRLSPIFRDREEFAAADDLTAAVRGALGRSDCLIVVCSPSAAASPWVAREIAAFRSVQPDRPVLAALIDGEPSEAYPPGLSIDGVEPLAADFRTAGDGERLARLKLAAGIAGVSLDALVQRDAQRRLARVTGVTVVAVAAMLVMAAMTTIAISARAEAERQRAEAEGLVQFMLTDLRTQLKGVGRLDIMTAVNKRAMLHYQNRSLPRLDANSRQQRAKALLALVEDNERRGDLAPAMAQVTEAWNTTRTLLDQSPNNPDRIFSHAQSEYWLGFLSWRLGLIPEAQAAWLRYAALADRLVAQAPTNPDWQAEAGYAESNLGTLALRDKYDAAAAEVRFARALQHFQVALKLQPGNRDLLQQIADGHAWLADSLGAQQRFDLARMERDREFEVLRGLLALDPANAAYRRDALGNDLGFARIDIAQGRLAAARSRLLAAYAQADRLAKGDPDDRKLARQRIVTGLFLAKVEMALGRSTVSGLLSECSSDLAQQDEELTPFCAALKVRAARAQGHRDSAAEDYLRLNADRLSRIRRSARWGIDFRGELAGLSQP